MAQTALGDARGWKYGGNPHGEEEPDKTADRQHTAAEFALAAFKGSGIFAAQ